MPKRIADIADTLGKAGAKVLTTLYDPSTQDATAYFRGMEAYYNAGITGKSIDSVNVAADDGGVLTAAQREAAYRAGKDDAAAGKSAEPGEQTDYALNRENIETEDKIYDEQVQGAARGGGDGERAYSLAASEQSGSVEARAGGAQAEGPGSSQAERAAQIRAAVEAQGVVSESTAGQ